MTSSKRSLRLAATFIILGILLVLSFWFALNAGYRQLSFEELLSVFTGNAPQSLIFTIVELRLPRILTVMLVGIGLSLSGCILQGISRNDMAEPGILGLNAGAGVLVAAFIVFVPAGLISSTLALPILAFIGAGIVALLDNRLSIVRGQSSPRRLLLVGVALATGLSALTSVFMLSMSDGDYAFVQNWLAGNIWGASWPNVLLLTLGLGFCFVIALLASRKLNILSLGTLSATGLGINVPRANLEFLALAVGCSGLCCAVGGGLTFVGLVCPHLARRLVGPNHRVLLIAAALVGAILMLIADIIARTLLAPNEIPIGIVAAVIGAPYFLYLLARS